VTRMRCFLSGVFGLLMASACPVVFSAPPPVRPEYALCSGGESFAGMAAAETVDALEALRSPFGSSQFYVSGIVGASFATLSSGGTNTAGGSPTPNTGAASDDLFTAGGSFGAAFERSHGLLRAELEGRSRDRLLGETASVETFGIEANDGWSVMANIWRDYFFTDRLGVYGGGGIGAGGYRLTVTEPIVAGSSTATEFAWQAGCGVTYRLGSQITLDLGYRFFDLGTASTPLLLGDGSPAGDYTSAFSASEILLSVRIYEPFRRFWR